MMQIYTLEKICPKCKKVKLADDFYKVKNGSKLSTYCIECYKQLCKSDSYKIADRKRKLKQRFGLTLEDWNKFFVKQNGKCAICGRHQSDLPKRLYVDHNHKTEEIRGLLCNRCNTILGLSRDDIDLLGKLINYLVKQGQQLEAWPERGITMSSANFQFEKSRNYQLNRKVVTGTYTVRTGRGTDGFKFDNPVVIDDPAADFTLTIPDGIYEGQTLLINLYSNASSKTVTVSASTGSGGDSTMATAGMYMYLLWVDTTTGWVAVKESVTS